MRTYAKPILWPDSYAKKQCEEKLKKISQASGLELYISAPDGQLAVMVNSKGTPQILFISENYHDILDTLIAIKSYIEVIQVGSR